MYKTDIIQLIKLLIFISSTTFLNAQTIQLSPLSIEASKIEEAPLNTTTIITEEISKERRDITMDEKLSSDVSFFTAINTKGEKSVSFRGLDYKNINYIEDGIPLFTATNGVDVNFMMPRGDIYFNDGSGVSLLGVSSIAGEVSINKKLPSKEFESTLLANISTNDQLYSLYAGSIVNDFYIQADASYYNRKSFTLSNDFKATPIQPKGERVNSDKKQQNFSLKMGYFLSDELHVAAKVNFSHVIYGIPPNTTENILSPTFFAFSRIDPKEMSDFYLYLDYDVADYELSARVYYDKYLDKFKIYADEEYDSLHPYAQDVVTYNDSRMGSVLKALRDSGSHRSTFLILAEQNEHNRLGGFPNDARSKVATLRTSLSDTAKLSNSFLLESAISYNLMKVVEGSDASASTRINDKSVVDGQVKLSYTMNSSSSYVGIAKKSRMPTMEEMFTFFPWSIANPSLTPEESMQYTLGTKYQFNTQAELLFDVYYYDIKNIIVLEDLGNTKSHYVNRESAMHYGGEVRLKVPAVYKQKLSFSYAYAHAQDALGEALEFIPEHNLRLEDRVKFTRDMSAFFTYTFVGSRYSLNSATYTSEKEKLDSYNLLDAQFIYNIHRSTKLRAGVKNILDENYEYNYGYPAEGRSFYMSLELTL